MTPRSRGSDSLRSIGTGIVVFALLLCWYVARYGDCASYFFHFDDFWVLADASRVAGVTDIFRPGGGHYLLYRPFSTVGYFWLLQRLFGYDAAPYHAAQLLAHVVNAFLVFGVGSIVLRSRLLGLGAAAIYAAEPGHTIAIYWNALFTMTGTASWYLACLWVSIGGLGPRPNQMAPGRAAGAGDALRGARAIERLRPVLCFVLFLGALLSSEHGVTLPASLAAASLLLGSDPWQRVLRRLAPFFLVAVVYSAAKIAYIRYGLDADITDPLVNFVFRMNYQPVVDPVETLRLVGFYTGSAIGWLHDSSPQAPSWYGVGAAMVALLAFSAWWATRSDAGRRMLFGLLLFFIPLAPVLILPGHPQSCYVGTAGAGIAIALMAATGAMPRFGTLVSVGAAAVLVTGTLRVGEPQARASEDFRFFRDFQRGALAWLDGVEEAARQNPGVQEMLLPSNAVTDLVFQHGQAHRLLLEAPYEVHTTKNLAAEPAIAGRLPVALPGSFRNHTAYPGRRPQWDWLRRTNPWQTK
jgi:hypothetical protein